MLVPVTPEVRVLRGRDVEQHFARLAEFVTPDDREPDVVPLSLHPAWLGVCQHGLRQVPYLLEASAEGKTRGVLPLAFVRSLLFGRFLVGLPYLNYGGVLANDLPTATTLIDRAVALADELNVKFLELRHTTPIDHPKLVSRPGAKVHMRRALPATAGELWKTLKDKVRNQVRKGRKHEFAVAWGGLDLLTDFYAVFSENMRDLGTPVFGPALFRNILERFPDRAEFCVLRSKSEPAAAALLLHGWGVTEVPSASSLRRFNPTCVNMLLYWQLLERAVQRGQSVFDFGRSTPESHTFKFKQQWGACPEPATWQYYVRSGDITEMRPDNPKYQWKIRLWRKFPLWLANLFGPWIVRGIP